MTADGIMVYHDYAYGSEEKADIALENLFVKKNHDHGWDCGFDHDCDHDCLV